MHRPGRQLPLINECRLRGALALAREAFYRELDGVVVADLPTSRQMTPVFEAIGLRPAPEPAACAPFPWLPRCSLLHLENHFYGV